MRTTRGNTLWQAHGSVKEKKDSSPKADGGHLMVMDFVMYLRGYPLTLHRTARVGKARSLDFNFWGP